MLHVTQTPERIVYPSEASTVADYLPSRPTEQELNAAHATLAAGNEVSPSFFAYLKHEPTAAERAAAGQAYNEFYGLPTTPNPDELYGLAAVAHALRVPGEAFAEIQKKPFLKALVGTAVAAYEVRRDEVKSIVTPATRFVLTALAASAVARTPQGGRQTRRAPRHLRRRGRHAASAF